MKIEKPSTEERGYLQGITTQFSQATISARKHLTLFFKGEWKNNFQASILFPLKLFFKRENKIKPLLDI